MQNMLSGWSKIWTEHTGHGYQYDILISINPSVPVIYYYMMDSQVITYTLNIHFNGHKRNHEKRHPETCFNGYEAMSIRKKGNISTTHPQGEEHKRMEQAE